MLYQQRTTAIGDLASQKQKQRYEKLGIVEDYGNNDDNEANFRKLVEQKENESNCFLPGQLRKRLTKAKTEFWYLGALSNKDVTKFEAIRQTYFTDAMHCLELIINTLG